RRTRAEPACEIIMAYILDGVRKVSRGGRTNTAPYSSGDVNSSSSSSEPVSRTRTGIPPYERRARGPSSRTRNSGETRHPALRAAPQGRAATNGGGPVGREGRVRQGGEAGRTGPGHQVILGGEGRLSGEAEVEGPARKAPNPEAPARLSA